MIQIQEILFIGVFPLLLVLLVVYIIPKRGKCNDKNVENYRDDMRKLWSEHVFWTREYLISSLDSLPSQDFIFNRLRQNQKDIGDLLAKKYGNDVGKSVTDLLTEHINGAVALVGDIK